ncbi:hypothetical protein EST38_g11997 [Candolleomyces aberdarensis]|uniref:Uncharacterized protein n=1 Tax=Candolleomyces aberdarensis TaxID=2316362 RepID=A0A4V1Q250_9AGAR|nr:hypothetical protein EST38_g11997 [Candolleomyces aberdarensis]
MSKPRFISKREAMSKRMKAKAHKDQTTVKKAISEVNCAFWLFCTGCPYCSRTSPRPKGSNCRVDKGGDVRVRNGRMVFEEPLECIDSTPRGLHARYDFAEDTLDCLDPRFAPEQPSRSDERMVVSLADIKMRVAKPKGHGFSLLMTFLVLTYDPSPGVRKEYDWVESVKPVLVMEDWDELEDTFSEDGWEEIDYGKQRSSGKLSYAAVASRGR